MKKKISMKLALVMLSVPAFAVYQDLEAIVAIVDDDVVLASELRSRYDQVVRQMRAQNVQMPPNDVIVSQLMERLILESIQRQEAAKRGIEIDDETLTRAVMSFAQNNNMTLEQFQAALAADGMGYREFREEIRTEMMITRLQRNLINRRISISEQDVQGQPGAAPDLIPAPVREPHRGALEDEGGPVVGDTAARIRPDAASQGASGSEEAENALSNPQIDYPRSGSEPRSSGVDSEGRTKLEQISTTDDDHGRSGGAGGGKS